MSPIFTDAKQGPNAALQAVTGLILLAGLFVVSRYNYLLFHGIAELFSIAVAWAVFMLVWNSRRFITRKTLPMLGVAYLFVGGMDLVHTLAYKDMGVFPGFDGANQATQLWIAARYMESLSLLLFAALADRSVRLSLVFPVYICVTALLLASVFVWPVFPVCFVDGSGLTAFKKVSEYVICLILVGAAFFLRRKRSQFDAQVYRIMLAAITLTTAGELAFTFYVSVYGFSNLVGHFCKIVSFYAVEDRTPRVHPWMNELSSSLRQQR